MKKNILFLILGIIWIASSCKRPEAPVFERVREINVLEKENNMVLLTAYADFYNPNNYRIILKKASIDVFLYDKKITNIEQDYDLSIEKNSDFSVPLQAVFSRDVINENILSHAVNILLGRKIMINYTGNIKVKAYGVRIRVPVQGETEINVRDF